MSPATIIREAQADGVRLTLSPSGTIMVAGDKAVLGRWLPVLRERKAEIIAALSAMIRKRDTGSLATAIFAIPATAAVTSSLSPGLWSKARDNLPPTEKF
jgi:hypothetical protein